MEQPWIKIILAGLIIVAVVIFRVGAGTAGAAGLGYIPMSKIPARLRRFLFGERNDGTHKLNHSIKS